MSRLPEKQAVRVRQAVTMAERDTIAGRSPRDTERIPERIKRTIYEIET